MKIKIFTEVYRRFKSKRNPYIWEGVYKGYKDVPESTNSYNDDSLVVATENYTKKALKYLEPKEEHALLPFLASVVCKSNNGKIRVLDFGGGMGIGYICLKNAVVNCSTIDYHIIELEKVCRKGAAIFNGNDQIHFHTCFPNFLEDVDIVYVNSALQYAEDCRYIITRLYSYKALYILFVRLAAGDIPTYVSVQQNIPGLKIPHWFLNINEIIKPISNSGYNLLYKGELQRQYNMDNFEEKYRLKHHNALLFSKKS